MTEPLRAESTYAKLVSELRDLSNEELVEQHDDLVRGGRPIDERYYLDELARRDASRREQIMVRLTWVIATLTLVNVVAVVVGLD